MPIERRPGPPREIPLLQQGETLYEVDLTAEPSPAWRAAFLRPSTRLTGTHWTPELGRVGLSGGSVHFRTTPDRLQAWLHRIDGWIDFANSVVEGVMSRGRLTHVSPGD